MSLARLTVDLVANLAQFEGDMGKAAQIVAGDTDKMTRAGASFIKSLERRSEKLGVLEADFLRVKAAELGVGQAAEQFISKMDTAGAAATRAAGASAAAFTAVGTAIDGVTARQRSNIEGLVAGIQAVNAEAARLKANAVADEKAGRITPDDLKVRLTNVSAGRTDAIAQLKAAAVQEDAARKVAETEAAVLAQRAANFENLRSTVSRLAYQQAEAQVTAAEKAAIQQSALNEKVAAEHIAAIRKTVEAENQAAAAEQVAVEKRRAALATLTDQLNGVTAAYRRNLEVLQASLKAGDITPKQFVQRYGALNEQQNPAVIAKRAEAAAALKAAEEVEAAAQRKAAAETKSSEAFAAAVNRQANAIGKLQSQLLAEEAALRGMTTQTSAAIAKIAEFERKTGQAGKGAFATANQLQTLRYTISDIVASAGSGISPFTILLQQGPQLAQVEGGITGMFKTVISLASPARLLIGGVAGAVGVLAYAFFQGSKQSREFLDSIVLTGNAAGLTEGRYNALAKSIAESGAVTLSAAREYTAALAATGEVGPAVFARASEAATRYGVATGKTAKEVATDFASMSRGVAQWAIEHNRSMNLLSAAQIEQIKRLEEVGRAADAQGIVYDALNARFPKLEQNLGYIEKALRLGATGWSRFWNAALDVGRTTTLEDRLVAVKERLAKLDEQRNAQIPAGTTRKPVNQKEEEDLRNERTSILRRLEEKNTAADNAAKIADISKKASDANTFVEGFEKRAKAVAALNRELAIAEAHFKAKKDEGKPVPEATQNAIRNQIRKDFTNPEVGQTDEAKAQAAIKVLQDQLQQERDLLSFHNAYVQNLYQAGSVTIEQFYADRESTRQRALAAELATLDKERKVQEDLLGKIPAFDTSKQEATRGKIKEVTAAQRKLQEDATRAGILGDQEREASLNALTDRVIEFRAQLAQLRGEEALAAELRAQQAENAAKRFQGTVGAKVISDEDLAKMKAATDTANAFAEVQRRVGLTSASLATAEEQFLLRAKQKGLSLKETEEGVLELRTKSLEQMAALAEQARKLAEASTDPRIKQFAAELQLQFEKLADALDPALQRVREMADSMAQAIAGSLVSAGANIDQLLRARTQKEQQDVDGQRKSYDDRIKSLQEYLAKADDAQTRARIKADIEKAKRERDQLGVSKTDVLLKTLERDVFGPILKNIQQSVFKVILQDPLEKQIQALLRDLTGNMAAALGGAKNFGGINGGAILPDSLRGGGMGEEAAAAAKQVAAASAQTSAVAESTGALLTFTNSGVLPSTSAIGLLTESAYKAAAALATVGVGGGGFGINPSAGAAFAGSGPTGGIDFSGIGFPLASGTNRVPYDGFLARLHEGEAVVPKAYNAANGGAMNRMPGIKIINNTPAVVEPSINSEGDVEFVINEAAKRGHAMVANDLASGTGTASRALKSRGVNLSGAMPRRG